MNKNRFLKNKFPAIGNNENLPVNYKFTQLYTNLSIDEQGFGLPLEDAKTIFVQKYQIPAFGLYTSFHKPISKFLEIPSDDKEFKKLG